MAWPWLSTMLVGISCYRVVTQLVVISTGGDDDDDDEDL